MTDTRHPFTDLVTGRECELVVSPGQPPTVAHPGCVVLADVSLELDAFYCRFCQWNGRVSGAWCLDLIEGRRGEQRSGGEPGAGERSDAHNPEGHQ